MTASFEDFAAGSVTSSASACLAASNHTDAIAFEVAAVAVAVFD